MRRDRSVPRRALRAGQAVLTLEKNPTYWREGYPRSDGLVFRFGVSPEEIKSEFLAGRLSIASDLLPADAEALRHDPALRLGLPGEPPPLDVLRRLQHPPAAASPMCATRRRIQEGIDAAAIVRRTMGKLAIPASGLIPPGLLGHTPQPEKTAAPAAAIGGEGGRGAHGHRPPFVLRRVRGLRGGVVPRRSATSASPSVRSTRRRRSTSTSSRPLPSTSSWAAGTATTRMRIRSFTAPSIRNLGQVRPFLRHTRN